MTQWMMVAGLAVFGVIFRYGTISSLNSQVFPLGTVAVNAFGSFLAGLVFRSEVSWLSDEVKTALLVGFLGALTTFSSFSLDLWILIEKGRFAIAVLYFFLTQISCFALCGLGMWFAQS